MADRAVEASAMLSQAGQVDFSLRDLNISSTKLQRWNKNYDEVMLSLMRKADKDTKVAVWLGALHQYARKKNPRISEAELSHLIETEYIRDKDAIAYADDITQKTAGSMNPLRQSDVSK